MTGRMRSRVTFGISARITMSVGHRRWILYPQTQVMGSGDVPEARQLLCRQCHLDFRREFRRAAAGDAHALCAWPPAGYVPYQVVFPQWSFALSNADLSAATVSMMSNGVSVAVTIQPYAGRIPWVMAKTPWSGIRPVWIPRTAARCFHLVARTPFIPSRSAMSSPARARKTFTYTVTVFDPAVPGADYSPPVISGHQPAIGQCGQCLHLHAGAGSECDRLPMADGAKHQRQSFRRRGRWPGQFHHLAGAHLSGHHQLAGFFRHAFLSSHPHQSRATIVAIEPGVVSSQ